MLLLMRFYVIESHKAFKKKVNYLRALHGALLSDCKPSQRDMKSTYARHQPKGKAGCPCRGLQRGRWALHYAP